MLTVLPRKTRTLFVAGSVGGTAEDDDELMLNVLRCHLTY